MEILIVIIIALLAFLTGCKIKAISGISLGILTVLSYIAYGIFILVAGGCTIWFVVWLIQEHLF